MPLSVKIVTPERTVFEADDVEAPRAWSQLATDIAVSKYFRRAGVPKTPDTPEGRRAEEELDKVLAAGVAK